MVILSFFVNVIWTKSFNLLIIIIVSVNDI